MNNPTDPLCVDFLLRREAKKSAIFIGEQDVIARNVPGPYDKPGRFRGQIYALFALMQSLILAYQFSDIHARTNVASEVSSRVLARHAVIRNPTILTVIPSESVLHD